LAGPRAPRGVVLDLRGNRGGLLRQAVTSVALLMDEGLVATTAGRDQAASHAWRVQGGDLAHGLPVVVLVDGRTASAAEVMAAALADGRRAVVVGSATLGKGLVQTITPLPDGGELFVTWSRILAPLGWPLQGLGVMPQVCTSAGEDATQRQLRSLALGVQEAQATLVAARQARAPLTPARVLALRAACPAMEGSDSDLEAARFLVAHPQAYRTGLLDMPPS
ncbi:MAG: S41 family peptidase, partial [Janthinobacterium lividum]